jgi:hypothetical protein
MTPAIPLLAIAAISCPVRVIPADADAKWNTAAIHAADTLSRHAATDKDCSAIVVEVHDTWVQVTLTTADGRRASRPVKDPDEIEPVVRALVVTLPPVESGASRSRPGDSAVATSNRPAQVGSQGGAQVSATGQTALPWGPFAIAAAASRLGFPGWCATPLAALSVGVALGHFESGVTGSREFKYYTLSGSSPNGFELSATSVDVFGGWRQPMRRGALVAGVRAGASFVVEKETIDASQLDCTDCQGDVTAVPVTRNVTEGRLGAYLAVVLPLKTRFRFRPQLSFDVVPARFGDHNTAPQSIQQSMQMTRLPSWGGTLTLALEGSLL